MTSTNPTWSFPTRTYRPGMVHEHLLTPAQRNLLRKSYRHARRLGSPRERAHASYSAAAHDVAMFDR